eukprot:PhM_4_TR8833/c0_g1_i1/m.53037
MRCTARIVLLRIALSALFVSFVWLAFSSVKMNLTAATYSPQNELLFETVQPYATNTETIEIWSYFDDANGTGVARNKNNSVPPMTIDVVVGGVGDGSRDPHHRRLLRSCPMLPLPTSYVKDVQRRIWLFGGKQDGGGVVNDTEAYRRQMCFSKARLRGRRAPHRQCECCSYNLHAGGGPSWRSLISAPGTIRVQKPVAMCMMGNRKPTLERREPLTKKTMLRLMAAQKRLEEQCVCHVCTSTHDGSNGLDVMYELKFRTPRHLSDSNEAKHTAANETEVGAQQQSSNETVSDDGSASSPKPLNVLYLFLDGATRCMVERYLPSALALLRKSHTRFGGGHDSVETMPHGERTINSAPVMMAGWPDGDEWFTSLFKPTPDDVTFWGGKKPRRMRERRKDRLLRLQREHDEEEERKSSMQENATVPPPTATTHVRKPVHFLRYPSKAHSLQGNHKAFVVNRSVVFESYLRSGLFAHFKKHGYITQAVCGNEEVDESAGVMTFWRHHPFVDHEFVELATTERKWDANPRLVGDRHVMEYPAKMVAELWRRFPRDPKFTLIYDAAGHFPHSEMLATSDRPIAKLLRTLFIDLREAENTAVVLMSDHFPHGWVGGHDRDAVRRHDRLLAEVWLPNGVAEDVHFHGNDDLKRVSFLTHFDWHEAVKGLATMFNSTNLTEAPIPPPRGVPAPPKAETLVRPLFSAKAQRRREIGFTKSGRTCASMMLPPTFCPYREVVPLSKSPSAISALVDLLNDEFEQYNADSAPVRAYCAEIPLVSFNESSNATPMPFSSESVVTRADDVEEWVALLPMHLDKVTIGRSRSDSDSDSDVIWKVVSSSMTGKSAVTRVDSWRKSNGFCFERCRRETRSAKCRKIFHGRCMCLLR